MEEQEVLVCMECGSDSESDYHETIDGKFICQHCLNKLCYETEGWEGIL